MNIIINGLHHPKQIEIISKLVKYYKLGYLLHICDPKYSYCPDIDSVVVENLSFDAAGKGNYPLDNGEPLDEVIIEKMAIYEPTVVKMMDRLEYYAKREYSYDERKRLYFNHLRYWNNLIKTKKIDIYIGTNIPHEVYDYVIYGLAKIYNIPTYFFLQSQINNLVHPMSDWEANCNTIPNEFLRLKAEKGQVLFDSIVEKEWKLQNCNVSPFYMTKVPFAKLFKHFFHYKNLKKYIHPYYYKWYFLKDVKRNYANHKLRKAYNKISVSPTFSSKYVYLALHYQPEMTTCPIGGVYVDQYLIVELLDKYLPDDVSIYIKEHPKQEIASRSFNYYSQILKNKKRVFFVPLKTSTFDLIHNSLAVATVTGTVGWEALFRNKPVMLFGHNFFQYAPGVFMIKSNDDCVKAIESIINSRYLIDKNDLKLFIQAVSNCSIKGTIDPAYDIVSDISIEESNINIFNWLKSNISFEI